MLTAARELGNILRHRDPKRALAAYDATLTHSGEIRENLTAKRDRAQLLANSSYALRALSRPAEAKQRVDAALALLKGTKDYPAETIVLAGEVLTVLRAAAEQQAAEGDLEGGVAAYEQLLDRIMATRPNTLGDLRDAAKLSVVYRDLESLYLRAGKPAKADTIAARRLDMWRQWEHKLPGNPFVLRQLAAADDD